MCCISLFIWDNFLVQSVVWFLSRWSSTYLLHPEEIITTNCYGKEHDNEFQSQHTRKVIYSFFGEHDQGIPILDIIIRISATTLLSYPGEKDLHVWVSSSIFSAASIRLNFSWLVIIVMCNYLLLILPHLDTSHWYLYKCTTINIKGENFSGNTLTVTRRGER